MSGWIEFEDFGSRIWLNTSHQGVLPTRAAEAGRRAIRDKQHPHRLDNASFRAVPSELRATLGALLSVDPEEVIPANGASYGLHLLANGLPLQSGDQVLVIAGDFPSNILPWLGLAEKGVVVEQLAPADRMPTPEEIDAAIGPRTRVLCMSWVHSFSGRIADLCAIGEICRAADVTFIANTTQGFGARPLDLAVTPVDAVVNAGWKWLLGPYATGFCWMRADLRDSLSLNQSWWQALYTADDLARPDLELAPASGNPRRYDLFSTANFFNFAPWCESLRALHEVGLDAVERHDQGLVQRLLDGLDRSTWNVTSPEDPDRRSTLVFLSHRNPGRNAAIHARLVERGIDLAHRAGELRISAHVHNTPDDIDRLLGGLED